MDRSAKTGDAPAAAPPRRGVRAAIAAALLAWSASVAAADAPREAYTLEIGDRVAISVFNRADLTGQFTIGPDGMIRMPLLGSLAAAGKTRAEIEAEVSARLDAILDHEAYLSVDIAGYRPIYVMGNVTTPGEYPYSPGLSVLQAFAKAGGAPTVLQLPYNQVAGLMAAELDLKLAETDIATLLVRRAALDASLADAGRIVLPPEIEAMRGHQAIDDMIQRETELLLTDRASLQSGLEMLRKQREQFGEEIRSLTGQQEAITRQTELVRAELRKIEGLAARGLASSQQVLELRATAAELDGERFEILAFLSRARQQVVQVDTRMREAETAWRRERLERRARIEAEIETARIQADNARRRLGSLAVTMPASTFTSPAETHFWITRKGERGTATLIATPDMPVMPGDVIRVSTEPPTAVSEAQPAQAPRTEAGRD